MANKKNTIGRYYVSCLEEAERLRNNVNGKKRLLPETWEITDAALLFLNQYEEKIGEGIAQNYASDSASSNTDTDSGNSQQTDSSSDTTTTTTTTSETDTTSEESNGG